MTAQEYANAHTSTEWTPADYETCQNLAAIDQLPAQWTRDEALPAPVTTHLQVAALRLPAVLNHRSSTNGSR